MNSLSVQNPELVAPSAPGGCSRRAIADLVRAIVHSRRGISRIAAKEWVIRFVSGVDRSEAEEAIDDVISLLCELNDVGFGSVRGEPVLFALPERRVALPDQRIIALGDHGIGSAEDSEQLFPEVASGATETLIDVLQEWGDVEVPDGIGSISPNGRWRTPNTIPSALRRALTLCGIFDPISQEWSISPTNAAFLNEWFDLDGLDKDSDAQNLGHLDASQQRVVDAPATARLVVEAGPGSGKTHVACERVTALVRDEAVVPSRILLLSFTRLAVAELRDRIASRLQELPNVAALQIQTFDSFAARLLSASGNGTAGGYDANIRAAVQLLRSGDPLVAEVVGQLEHVIIDEAQDLIGYRKELCNALLNLLHPECGVTVFGDFAQSIYGYQRSKASETTFLADVGDLEGYNSVRLEHDHRTKTENLRKLFHSARGDLSENSDETRDMYFHVRERIRVAALENDIANYATHPSTTRGLVLTRSRRGLIAAAEAMRSEGRHFRLRLPDRPLRVAPWIGATLGGLSASERISSEAFGDLYGGLDPKPARSITECWEILLDLDGSGRDTIQVGHVAEALEDPPLELVNDHEGRSGPLLSTIHAVKGREDERVMLLFTRAPYGDQVDWGEETRTLYVGATRASTELRTGWVRNAKFYRKGNPQRYWAARADHRLIEIGLEGDLITWQEFSRSTYATNPTETVAAIWRCACEEVNAEATRDASGRLVIRETGSGSPALGCISSEFGEAMQSIRQVPADAPLPDLLSDFAIVGATTVVVPGQAGNAPTLALMPLLGGFARVAR